MRGVILGGGLALLALGGAGAQTERMRVVDPLGGVWRPVRIGAAAFPPIKHAALIFYQDSYATQAGCGNFVGRYVLEGARIRTRDAEPVQTGKCDSPANARSEKALAAVMAGAASWSLLPDGSLQITTRAGVKALFRRPSPAVPALAGRWEVERIGKETIAAGRSVRVDFEGGSVSATAECNSMGAEVAPAGKGALKVVGGSATQMGCGPVREAFDERLFAAVGGARRYAAQPNGRMRLEGGPEALVLRPFRLEPWRRELPGAYKVCGSNPRGVLYDGPATVTFESGRVRDNTGCGGAYTSSGAALDIRLEKSAACSAAPAPADGDVEIGAERSLLAVLRPDAYAFDEEGRLRMRTRRGTLDLCREGRRWFGTD